VGPIALAAALVAGAGATASSLHAQRGGSARGCEGDDCEAMRDYIAELSKLRAEVSALVRQQAKLQAAQKRGDELEALDGQIRYATRKLGRLQSRLSKDRNAESRAESSALIAQLQQQLRQLAARQAQQAQAFAARAPRSRAQAQGGGAGSNLRGYIGIVYTSQGTQVVRTDGSVVVNHPDYPVVESVEPGSPAEKAGMASGDTIIAYNRRDLRNRDVVLTEIIQPNKTLLVTVKRDGRLRTVPVMVADRAENPEIPEWSGTPPAAAAPPRPARVMPPPPAAAVAPALPVMTLLGRNNFLFQGAEFVRMNDDLREVFDVRGGVLVYGVGSGTPAAQAGLRGGDVVVSVNDTKVNTLADLQRVLVRSDDRDARLKVVRKKREVEVELRW